jgi:hypothetical protein
VQLIQGGQNGTPVTLYWGESSTPKHSLGSVS